RHHQIYRRGVAQGDRRNTRPARASVSVRESARELGRRSRSLSRNGSRIPEGIEGAMTLPRHVWWFQVLLYSSLVLDALSVAFQDRTPTATMTDTTILATSVISACMILLFLYLVWLAAQQ